MDEVIDKNNFAALAAAGGISLTADEAENLREEINRQMCVIRQLDVIPLEDHIRPVTHGNPYPEAVRCELREDINYSFENKGGIIAQAPVTRNGYIVSPDVPHQKIG